MIKDLPLIQDAARAKHGLFSRRHLFSVKTTKPLLEGLNFTYGAEGGIRTPTGSGPLRPERSIWGFGAMPRNAKPCPGAPFLGFPNSCSCPKMPRNAPALLHYCYIFGMPKGWTLREKLDH
jgi:hypothetical protein